MIGNDRADAERIVAVNKLSQHVDGGSYKKRILVGRAALPLKTGFIDGMRTQYLRVADLNFILIAGLVIALGRQRQLAYTVILFIVVRELVPGHQRIGS